MDALELAAMLKDMLEPPCDDTDRFGDAISDTKADSERASASIDETMDSIEASEERNAAMESEAIKRPGH